MGKYDDEVETARELLEEFGKTIVLNRETTSGDYDVISGSKSKTSETVTGVGVLLNYKKEEIDGTTILKSDRKLLFSGPLLQVDDKYGKQRIFDNEILAPDDDQIILQTCQMRV